MNELRKLLDGLRVTATAKEITSIPAREVGERAWRITLTRTLGRGKNAQELRLGVVMRALNKPLVYDVTTCLVHDTMAGEQKLWDFAQTFGNGKADEYAEGLHYTCRKLGKRVKRFFGEQWPEVLQAEQGVAPGQREKKKKKN